MKTHETSRAYVAFVFLPFSQVWRTTLSSYNCKLYHEKTAGASGNEGGAISQLREISANRVGNTLTALFGLGSATVVDTLEVRRPSGTVDRSIGLAADRAIVATEGTAVTDATTHHPLASGSKLRATSYPNPFNPSTTIAFEVSEMARVSAVVYDMTGRAVRHLADRTFAAGPPAIGCEGDNDSGRAVSSGVYFVRLVSVSPSGSSAATVKITVVK